MVLELRIRRVARTRLHLRRMSEETRLLLTCVRDSVLPLANFPSSTLFVFFNMLLSPFMSAMLTPVGILELLKVYDHGFPLHNDCRRIAGRAATHRTLLPSTQIRILAGYDPLCRDQLFLFTNELLVYKFDMESASTLGAVSKEFHFFGVERY